MIKLRPPDYSVFISTPVVNKDVMEADILKVGNKIDYLKEGQRIIFTKGKFGRVVIGEEEVLSVSENYILGIS